MGVLDTRFEGALSLLTRFFFFPASIEGTLLLVEAPDTLALEVFEVLEFCVDACLEALVDVQGLQAILSTAIPCSVVVAFLVVNPATWVRIPEGATVLFYFYLCK